MGVIPNWVLSKGLSYAGKKLAEYFFQDHELQTEISKAVDKWIESLPEHAKPLSREAVLCPKGHSIADSIGPRRVQDKLKAKKLPIREDWHEDLTDNWDWVVSNIPERQNLFLISRQDAIAHLARLADSLVNCCIAKQELFNAYAFETLGAIRDDQQKLTSTVEAFRDEILKSTLSLRSELDKLTTSADSDTTAEIDEAKAEIMNGQPQAALYLLAKLEQKGIERLSENQRFRLYANFGHAHLINENLNQAISYFKRAAEFDTQSLKSISIKALAAFLEGNNEHSREISTALIDLSPNSHVGYPIWIKVSTNCITFDEILARVPESLRLHDEVAFALAWSALLSARIEEAEYFAKNSFGDSEQLPCFELMATVLIQKARRLVMNANALDAKFLDPQLLDEAQSFLDKMAAKLSDLSNAKAMSRWEYLQGSILTLQGKAEQSIGHFANAYRTEPENPFYCRLYASVLADKPNKTDAISVLESGYRFDSTGFLACFLVRLLFGRASPGDVERAVAILREYDVKRSQLDEKSNFELNWLLIDAESENVDFDQFDCFTTNVSSETARWLLKSRAAFAMQKIQEASEFADKARDCDSPNELPLISQRLADHFIDLNEPAKALTILKRFVRPGILSTCTFDAVNCAFESHDDAFVLEIGASLRDKKIYVKKIGMAEVNTLFRNGQGNSANALSDEYKNNVADLDAQEFRLVQINLCDAFGISRASVTQLEQLPEPAVIKPGYVRVLLKTLLNEQRAQEALKFAFANLSAFPRDEIAHFNFITLLLAIPENAALCAAPNSIIADCAFILKNTHSGDVIEFCPDPIGLLGEESVDSTYLDLFLGCQSGDRRRFENGPVASTFEVVEIVNRFVYRARRCLAQWNKRFPRSQLLWPISVESVNKKLDLQPLVDILNQQQEIQQKRRQVYLESGSSLYTLAQGTHQSPIEAYGWLRTSKLPIRVSQPLQQHLHKGNANIANKSLVLDESVIAFLFWHKMFRLIPALGKPVFVSESTLVSLRSKMDFFSKSPMEQSVLKELEQLVNDGHMRILDGSAALKLETAIRKQIREYFGQPVLECIAAAATGDFVFWTDDIFARFFAISECQVAEVSTERLIRAIWAEKRCDREMFVCTLAELMAANYVSIEASRADFELFAAHANWDSGQIVIQSFLRWFSNDLNPIGRIVLLLEDIYRNISISAPSTFVSDSIIYQIFEAIRKRSGGLDDCDLIAQRVGEKLYFNNALKNLFATTYRQWRRQQLVLPRRSIDLIS